MYKCRNSELKRIPEDVLNLTAGQLVEGGDCETLASFALASSAFHEIASRYQCSHLTIRFGALDAPLSAMRLHSIINTRQRESNVRDLTVQGSKTQMDDLNVEGGTGLFNAWTATLIAMIPRLTGLTSFTWNCPVNLPLSVLKAVVTHDKIASLSLALKEDGSNVLLPALNGLADQSGRKLQITNLCIGAGLPKKASANGMEAVASHTENPRLPFLKVMRKTIIHSVGMKTLMFMDGRDMSEEDEKMLFNRDHYVEKTMTKPHPLRSLSVQGTTGMATYTLFGAQLSNLTCLELLNIDFCDTLIEALTWGTTEINLKILRVADLFDQVRAHSPTALRNLLNAFQGLEELELDGLDIDDFIDSVIHHGATLRTVSLIDNKDENDRAILKRRAVSYCKLAKGCPHLRRLRVNEIPNVVGIADAFVGNALQNFNRLETLILMPTPRSSPSSLHPISDMQIYSAARSVMSQKLKTLEVIGAYMHTQCSRFEVFRRPSRADIVDPERRYHWRIDCRKYNLSPVNMMAQLARERDLLTLQQNEILAKCLGKPKCDALNGDALRIEAVSRYHEAIQRLSQASYSSPEGFTVVQTPQQSYNDLKPPIISLGYDCQQAQDDLKEHALMFKTMGN